MGLCAQATALGAPRGSFFHVKQPCEADCSRPPNVKVDSAWSNTSTRWCAFMAYTRIMLCIISLSRAVFFILSLCCLHDISMEINCRSDQTQCLFFSINIKKLQMEVTSVWGQSGTEWGLLAGGHVQFYKNCVWGTDLKIVCDVHLFVL
jgi:hypothetical protein